MFDEKYPEPDPNKRPQAQVWDERYSQTGFLFGKEACVTLKSYGDVLRKGKVLDVAMGEGRNSVFLAKKGFQVEGIDCSTKAIEKAKSLATEQSATVEAKVQNLDFFLMPLMKYDSVIMTYYKPQARFFSEIRRGLVQGGTFLLEAHTTEHMRLFGKDNPNLDFDQSYKPNEILSYLKEFQILLYQELPGTNERLVQVIAQKTGR